MAKMISNNIKVELEENDFEDIIDTAGYGISYWASSAVVRNGSYEILIDEPESEDLGVCLITPEVLVDAWQKILNREVAVSDDIYSDLLSGDAGDIDAGAADVLIQVACFKGIVYG